MKVLNNWIVKNLLGAIAFVLALVLIASFVLGRITRHGQVVSVPDLTNVSVAEAAKIASDAGLRTVVFDSVYVRRMQKGAVFSQNPKAGSSVKHGRKIRLTINATLAKKVTMPNLVGYSIRQAKAELASKGLYLGKIVYVSDIATNNVLKQLYRNTEIRPGRMIESGATVDLVAGLSETESMTNVPDVRGMKCLRAIDAIQNNSLNIGKLKFDSSVKNYSDSLNAVVLNQSPAASRMPMRIGSEVTLALSIDPEKVAKVGQVVGGN